MLNSSKEYLEDFKAYLEVERNFSEHTSRAYVSDILSFILWLVNTPLEDADFTKLRNFCYYIFCDDEKILAWGALKDNENKHKIDIFLI